MRRFLNSLMKRKLTLTLIAVLSLLVACGDSMPSSDAAPVLEPAPAELRVGCVGPVVLPERDLTQAEVETFWLRDRGSLIECGDLKDALEEYYVERDGRVAGRARQSASENGDP